MQILIASIFTALQYGSAAQDTAVVGDCAFPVSNHVVHNQVTLFFGHLGVLAHFPSQQNSLSVCQSPPILCLLLCPLRAGLLLPLTSKNGGSLGVAGALSVDIHLHLQLLRETIIFV